MNVLVLSTLYPSTAQPTFGVFVENSVALLAAQPDFDVRVIAPVGLPPAPLDRLPAYAALRTTPRHEVRSGVSVSYPRFALLPMVGWRFNPAAILRVAAREIAALRAEGFVPDVIDAQFFFPEGVAAVALGRRFGLPVTIKARGADINHWGRFRGTAAAVLKAARSAQGLTAVSADLRRTMIDLGMPAERIDLHHTLVDLSKFHAEGRDRARAALTARFHAPGAIAICVGSLIPRKDHALLLDGAEQVPGLTVLLAGDGPLRGELEARVRGGPLAGRVHFLGKVAHADLAELYRGADIALLTSRSEGLANVLVEAVACGTPVAATDVEGTREVLDASSGTAPGAIIAERTSAAVASAIAAVLAAGHTPEAVRRHAEKFSPERHLAAKRAHLEAVVTGYRVARAG